MKINWKRRLERHDGERALVTVDGVDFGIYEPTPFDRRWYSHKMNGPGIRYEITIAIKTGVVVSYNGPFECGRWPDLKIFQSKLLMMLGDGEKVIADGGYKGEPTIITPGKSRNREHYIQMGKARARHETFNGRMKTWGCMKNTFRHPKSKHNILFRACLVLEQIKIDNGHSLFQVDPLNDKMY